MAKEKLGIVSSYNELCGNASYTKALAQGLSKHFDVTVVSLNVELLRKGDSRSARLYIKKICEELRQFDCVNIQFEAGLFGLKPRTIQKRFFAIAKACKRFVLTMHRFHAKVKYPSLPLLAKTFLKGNIKKLILAFQYPYANNRHLPMYYRIIRFCRRRNAPILVHTQRDRDLIKIKFNYDRIFDHPLCFYDQEYIESIRKTFARKDFCQNLSLREDKAYVGMFGFINRCKGHETMIRALEFLPENYELLIFGSQHPHTIKLEEPIDDYIERLVKLTTDLKLTHRVKFFGSLNDDEFLKALVACDFNVLPYLEVNQGGSAIAALSLETGSNTIFSLNCAFHELSKYAPNSFKMMTIGNHLELANAILTYRKSDFSSHLSEYHKKYNIHTSTALYQRLLTEIL